MSTPPVVVILCGFMATGKTSVGRALAELLQVPFIDSDDLVETRAGTTIAEIFAQQGEAHFRDLEAEVCTSLAVPANADGAPLGAVIATGGGALMREETFKHLESLGTMVLLEASLDEVMRRASQMSVRPKIVSPESTQQLYEERKPTYHRIAHRVDTTRRNPAESAYEVSERLNYIAPHAPQPSQPESLFHMRAGARPVPGRKARPGEEGLTRLVIGRGALAKLGEWIRACGMSGHVYVFVSRTVAGFHGAAVRAALDAKALPNKFIQLDDKEESKTMEQAEALLYELADAGATRDSIVVALGGGVTGDVAGYVAATYMRGLALVQVPTTLLSQVDSSIGGKVGVNHPRAKNLLGAIYQPQLILTDVEVLSTLPEREVASGMAEVVKSAIIGAPELFAKLEKAGKKISLRNAELLDECVAACARVKAQIVEEDPYEQGLRRVLNLGHTVGHALEQATGYGVLTHGEAVAFGMLAAMRISVTRGLASAQFEKSTRWILAACGLPFKVPQVSHEDLLQAMSLDKKRAGGGLSFVLPIAPGDVRIVDDVTDDEIIAAFEAI